MGHCSIVAWLCRDFRRYCPPPFTTQSLAANLLKPVRNVSIATPRMTRINCSAQSSSAQLRSRCSSCPVKLIICRRLLPVGGLALADTRRQSIKWCNFQCLWFQIHDIIQRKLKNGTRLSCALTGKTNRKSYVIHRMVLFSTFLNVRLFCLICCILCLCNTKMTQDRFTVTVQTKKSNGAIFNDREWPLT